jgi:microcin C transport system substrate-binding protein
MNVSTPPVERYPRYWEYFHSKNAHIPNTNNFTNTADPEMDRLIDAYDTAPTMDDIRRLAQVLEKRIYDNAAFIPAFEYTYFRAAYWRWLKFPPTFATRESSSPVGVQGFDYGLAWIDDQARPAVRAAAQGGQPLPPEIHVYEQWKQP